MGLLAGRQKCQNLASWSPALGIDPSFPSAPAAGGAQLCVCLQEVSSRPAAMGTLTDSRPSSHFVNKHVETGAGTSLEQTSQRSAPWAPS